MVTAQAISAEFPFESHYVEVHGSKMHYVDVGQGDPILFLHGNPTSSYLWRNIIPHVQGQGRCIAPDLIGMGKSDKPDIPYRFADHYRYIEGFIEALGLTNITLVIHDWGSGLGFHYATQHPDNIKGIAFMEAITAYNRIEPLPVRLLFGMMRTPGIGGLFVSVLNQFVNFIIPFSVVRDLTAEEMRHYREPFPTVASRKPVLQWPREIPISGQPADVSAIVDSYTAAVAKMDVPKLFLYAHPGAIILKDARQQIIDTFTNLTAVDIGKGRHYVQEDNPHGIGEAISTWYASMV